MPVVLGHTGYCNILDIRIQEMKNSKPRLKEKEKQEAVLTALFIS